MTGMTDYDNSVQLARAKDPALRAMVANRDDVPPEILFFLANDPNPTVRSSIAANTKTPSKADLLLASDRDVEVRSQLATKVATLLPHLDQAEQQAAENRVLEVLELLARDQAVQVRRILAETLKDERAVPETVIKHLARDSDDLVAVPLLEFSPLLEDNDLISIIQDDCGTERLCAISRRNGLSADVSDAIVARDHEPAITELLENHSAQIRENTLDALVDRAATVASWQAPLARRPSLPSQTVQKLSKIVADSLLDQLLERSDLDPETEAAVREEVRRRLEQAQDEGVGLGPGGAGEGPDASPAVRPDEEETARPLTRAELQKAAAGGDRATIRENLITRSKIKADVVDRILDSKNPMALTALSWKAGLTMKFSVQLQLRICGVAPDDLLNEKKGGIFPMTPEEMNWQIDFFESSYGWRSQWKSAGGAGE